MNDDTNVSEVPSKTKLPRMLTVFGLPSMMLTTIAEVLMVSIEIFGEALPHHLHGCMLTCYLR